MDLTLFSEFFYSTFLRIDKYLFSSFNVDTSFADNTDQTIVYILAFILVGGLLVLLLSGRKERKIIPKSIDKSIENTRFKTKMEDAETSKSEAAKENFSEELEEIKPDAQESSIEVSVQENEPLLEGKSNIYELDNGFVINKRSNEKKEVPDASKSDNTPNDKAELVSEKNNISEFMSPNFDDSKQTLTSALSEIEAAMLDVRQEYKTGKISSVDYLAKTQDLYKKGEELVEKQVS
ncbi:hypothetical protein OA085_00705 [Alphaproteobacteria bacterium]|nr:hypothetical protein [Alphaproteobacteria bacterium]